MSAQIERYGKLAVRAFGDRESMGKASADHVVKIIQEVLKVKEYVNIIFAAAPSQNEFLDHLVKSRDVDWSRVVGFHMDEYIGLPPTSDQFFGLFLQNHLFSRVAMKAVHLFDSQASDPLIECSRYESLLRSNPPDLACMGIGENAHIAFNDPPVADFNDKRLVKIAELDVPCRQQQVNDGCFPTVADVPPIAFTLTVPALMSATYLSIVAPTERKAKAIHDTLTAEITTAVPASIMRTHPNAVLFLDSGSAKMLPGRTSHPKDKAGIA
jgi:glucosamine-6-phosphate deaminase